jgi:hypothetical protein
MYSIVWPAVIAAVCGVLCLAVAVFRGPHEIVLALAACGVIAAVLNRSN